MLTVIYEICFLCFYNCFLSEIKSLLPLFEVWFMWLLWLYENWTCFQNLILDLLIKSAYMLTVITKSVSLINASMVSLKACINTSKR